MAYNLLSVGSNPKIDKSNKVSSKYWSVIMHLRPVNTKICPYQDIAKCKSACLNTAGRGGIFKKGDNMSNEDIASIINADVIDVQQLTKLMERAGELICMRRSVKSKKRYSLRG